MNEQAIIYGCLHKDPLCQRELYNYFSPKMLGVCYRFASNKEDAEDMMQDGFIRVFTMLHSYAGEGSFEGWVRRIIVNNCINFLKKHKKFNESIGLEFAEEFTEREESLASRMQGRQVVECIRCLPMGYRTVLNLYAIEGYSHKEISELLGVGESTSRSQYTRAKVLLEKVLLKKGIIENTNKKIGWLSPAK